MNCRPLVGASFCWPRVAWLVGGSVLVFVVLVDAGGCATVGPFSLRAPDQHKLRAPYCSRQRLPKRCTCPLTPQRTCRPTCGAPTHVSLHVDARSHVPHHVPSRQCLDNHALHELNLPQIPQASIQPQRLCQMRFWNFKLEGDAHND